MRRQPCLRELLISLIVVFAFAQSTRADNVLFDRIPPIRYWGTLGYDYRVEDLDGNEHVGRIDLNGATFIYQPWIAQLEGGLGLRFNDTGFKSGRTSGEFLTGHARLTVFPVSRFPFETFFERTDTHTDTDLVGLDLDLTRYGVDQRYSSERLGALDFRYEHTDQNESETSKGVDESRSDETDLFRFKFNRSFNKHQLHGDSELTFIDRDETQESTELFFSSLRHEYRPGPTFSLENRLTYNGTTFDQPIAPSESGILESNSYGFWRPRTAKRLVMNGTLRVLRFNTEAQADDMTSTSVFFNGGTTYEWSPRLRYFSNSSFAYNVNEEDSGTTTTQRVGLDYTSDNIQFSALDYSWFAGADLSHFSDEEGSFEGFGTQLGHNFTRQFIPSENSFLQLTARQSVDQITDTDGRSTQSLLNNITTSWNQRSGARSVLLNLSGSDFRQFGGGGRAGNEESEFQLVNLQGTANQRLRNNAIITGNLTIQTTRSISAEQDGRENESDAEWRPTASINLEYSDPDFFGVPRLRLRTYLQLLSDAYLPIIDEPRGDSEREETIWDTRLEYTIGRLDFRFIGRFSRARDENRSLLMFQMRRFIGN